MPKCWLFTAGPICDVNFQDCPVAGALDVSLAVVEAGAGTDVELEELTVAASKLVPWQFWKLRTIANVRPAEAKDLSLNIVTPLCD